MLYSDMNYMLADLDTEYREALAVAIEQLGLVDKPINELSRQELTTLDIDPCFIMPIYEKIDLMMKGDYQISEFHYLKNSFKAEAGQELSEDREER